MAKAKVAIVRTKPETVLADHERLLALAGAKDYLKPGTTTILKDNISWHYPFPSANTTPWQLEGTIRGLRALGYDDISCVQNKTVVTNAFKGEDLNKYLPIFKRYNIPVLYNFREDDMKWVNIVPKAEMLVLNKIYPEGIRVPEYFYGKNIVHLPTVKCHIYTTTTGAMKNAFGGLLTHKRHYTHSWINETLVDLLAIQKEIHTGLFAVMDGTTAGNGAGPRIMTPVRKDVALASGDQVAIDAIAALMMGFDPMSLPFIRIAHERGLGVGDPREIEVVGDTDAADERWGFKVAMTMHRALGWLSWYGPTKVLQKLIFHTPLVNIPIVWSEVYHDYYRWNVIDKRTFEKWKKESPWGALFGEYERRGAFGTEVAGHAAK